jgi:hypothetical protein
VGWFYAKRIISLLITMSCEFYQEGLVNLSIKISSCSNFYDVFIKDIVQEDLIV